MNGVWDALESARVYDLEQPRYAGAPLHPSHEPGSSLFLHRRHEAGAPERRTGASGVLVMTEHSGTHIDALCHQAWDMELHGGVRVDPFVQTPAGFTALGMDTVAPIVRRGVLLDAARHAGVERLPDHAEVVDLAAVAEAQGTELRPGDAVLVRTGNGALWADRAAYEAGPGMSATASRWVAERRPFLVGADNVAWDLPDRRDPELGSVPGHTILITQAGIHIVENLLLEELARDEVWEFAFLCLPLKVRGGTGSPVRPIALA